MPALTDQLLEAMLDAPSVYPQAERKPREQRRRELVEWYEAYGDFNEHYNLYGMDRADALPWNSWLDYGKFRKTRYDINSQFFPPQSPFPYNFTLIMRSKLVFEQFCAFLYGNNSSCYLKSHAVFIGPDFYVRTPDGASTPTSFAKFIAGFDDGHELVFKQAFGMNGKQILFASVQTGSICIDGESYSPAEFAASFAVAGTTWLVQDRIAQHEFMNRLNESSVNTLRIITYHTGERIVLDNVAVRYGKPGSRTDNVRTDSESRGGYFSSIGADGTIGALAFDYVEKTGTPAPASGKIPFYDEAVKLACDMHAFVPEVFSVGWDVAITPDGPIMIEGNDGWGPVLTQTELGCAQRPAWDKYLAERKRYAGMRM